MAGGRRTEAAANAAREASWREPQARLDAAAPRLERRGSLTAKAGRGRVVHYCVRYTEVLAEGKSVRRSIYVGQDPELVRRVEEYLGQCRQRGRERDRLAAETIALAELAQALGARWRRQIEGREGGSR